MNKEKQIKLNLGKILIIFGVFLITLSVAILIHNSYLEINAGIKSQDAINVIKNNLNKTTEIVSINADKPKEMSTINIAGYDYIGSIIIPTLGLELPVMSNYDNERLNVSPCRYYGSIYTNDLIICGHSYKTHFKYLSNLVQGDTIIFTDVFGDNYIYEVLEIEILDPKAIDEMINNEFDLTLYTCTNDGLNRITIRCNRITNNI